MSENTIEQDIFLDLTEKGRGRIFFAQEYYDRWPDSTVRFTLAEMAKDGQIVRLARGVFCFPKVSDYGMKMILPEPDSIADAIAEKSRIRIVPYGDQAAYLVGLAAFQFSKTTYLTDGAPRIIHLSNGRTIEFRHTSEMRIFAFRNRKMQLLSNGIRAVGKDRIKADEKEAIKFHLSGVPTDDFNHDLQLCPEWVRDILLDSRGY